MTPKHLENGANLFLIDNESTRKTIADALAEGVLNLYLNVYVDEHEREYEKFFAAAKEVVLNSSLAELLTSNINVLQKKILALIIEERLSDFIEDNSVEGDDGQDIDVAKASLEIAEKYINGSEMFPVYLTDDDMESLLGHMGYEVHWDDEDEDDETEEEEETDKEEKHYEVKLSIDYHKDYTVRNLSKRVMKRLMYQWKGNDIIVHIQKEKGKNVFEGTATIITNEGDLKAVIDKVLFRLGATSGKPWKRCHVLGIAFKDEETENNL